jgi:diguanylate cyclase (GGDEF)-like protein/PAS domain S-box-containing protein
MEVRDSSNRESPPLSREALTAIMDQLPVGVFVLDATGQASYANAMAVELLGRGAAPDTTTHMLAETYEAYVAGTDERYPIDRMPVVRALAGERSQVHDMEIRRPDRTIPLCVSGVPIRDADGRVAFAVATFEDVGDMRRTEEARRQADERFRVAFHSAPIGMALVDVDGRFLQINRAMCTLTGYSEPELLTLTIQEVTHPDDVQADAELVRQLLAGQLQSYQMEKRYVRPYGAVRWGLMSRSLVTTATGRPVHFVTQVEDITERKEALEALAHRAFHDPLTGLANRALLLDRLQHGLDRLARHQTPLTVLYVDLDNLKAINDTLGHDSGDAALVGVARALKSSFRAEDTVARVGGDEFVVVCEDFADAGQASTAVERVQRAVAGLSVGEPPMTVRVSTGLAVATGPQERAESLLRRADAAMYAVKLARRSGAGNG